MFCRILAIFTLLFYFNHVLASEYSSYELVPFETTTLNELEKSVSFLNLIPLNKSSNGGIEIFGINQLFVSSDFNSMISFKFDVRGTIELEKWEMISSGMVYHYKKDGKINAVFFHGISYEDANKVINKLKTISITQKIINALKINSAYASDCQQARLMSAEFPAIEKISSSVIFNSLLACGSGMKTGAYDSTIGVADMAWSGLKAVGNEVHSVWTNPKQKMDQYYNGVVKGALVVKDVFTFITDMMINPEKAESVLKNKYGSAADKVIEIFGHLKNLPTPLMVELSCSIITGIGIDTLITYLTVGAGSAKLVLTMIRLSEQFKVVGKIFQALNLLYQKGGNAITLSKEKIEIFTKRLMQNKIPEEDLEYINKFLGSGAKTDSMAIEALSCYIK